ncbi:MAG: ATP-binding protein [Acidobacteriota bacterium]
MNEAYFDWGEANQGHLTAALAAVRATLEHYTARVTGETPPPVGESMLAVQASLQQTSGDWPENLATPALDALREAFLLSSFERNVLLLCAGMELDASFGALCAAAQGDARRAYPTFGLALASLPEAHWDALSPAAPLRRWRLIEVMQSSETLTNSQLRIDECVLHYLAGVEYMDDRLRGLVQPVISLRDLPPTQRAQAERVVEFWKGAIATSSWPIIFLGGNDTPGKRAVAAAACAAIEQDLYIIRAPDLPSSVAEREALARLWEREAALREGALLLDQEEQGSAHAVGSFLESLNGVNGFGETLLVMGGELPRVAERPVLRVDVNKPSAAEQCALWEESLGPLAPLLNGQLDPLVAQFNLSSDAIQFVSLQTREAGVHTGEALSADALWEACRIQARPRLDNLAQRIEPGSEWDDLVLPEHQMRTLRDIAVHVRQRTKVYESWGFAKKGARGLGISVLFAGASGTGKTMAAEVLAGELRLDLYRIDLSQVVSKYIGETEKNLRHVFDAAEEGGAVLLFDEADALFGKRSEVKDSHDRYANIEVSYLLQRMEAYRGLAVLTTNLKAALDPAFLRRLRFVVQFPFPDAAQRAEIWRHIFPRETPVEGLDIAKLGRLNITGGNIRNIAMQAAFLAADSDEPVTMAHLLRAARGEYDKLEKPLTETEIAGWL